jgi:hypothetical protein
MFSNNSSFLRHFRTHCIVLGRYFSLMDRHHNNRQFEVWIWLNADIIWRVILGAFWAHLHFARNTSVFKLKERSRREVQVILNRETFRVQTWNVTKGNFSQRKGPGTWRYRNMKQHFFTITQRVFAAHIVSVLGTEYFSICRCISFYIICWVYWKRQEKKGLWRN